MMTTRPMPFPLRCKAILSIALSSLILSCGSEPDESSSQGEERPIVLLAQRVQNPDSRQIYVSLLPDLPQGSTSRSDAYEFGSIDLFVNAGRIFVFDRERITMTRYRATDDFRLEVDLLESGADAVMSLQQEGLPGFGFDHVFVSESRAYLIDWAEYRVLVWNPTTMEVGSTIDLSVAVKEDYVLSDSYLVSPVLADGTVFIAIYVWQSYDSLRVHPGTGVIALDAASDAAPVLLEDARVTGASKLFRDGAGRVLVVGDQYSGLYNHFGSGSMSAPPAGVLRIDGGGQGLGALAFDPTFFVNLLEVTGSPSIYAAYQVDGSNLLLQAWDPDTPMNAPDPDAYWSAGEYLYLLVDLEARTSQRVTNIPKAAAGSVQQFRLDGQLYVQTYEERVADIGRSSIVHRVRPDGVREAFRIPGGDLWALERVR